MLDEYSASAVFLRRSLMPRRGVAVYKNT